LALAQAIDSKYGAIDTFNIEATLPVFLNSYTNPVFNITDTLTAGLELLVDADHPITVAYGNRSFAATSMTAVSNNDLTITPNSNKRGLVISFKAAYLKSNVSAQDLVITYFGKVINPSLANMVQDHNDVVITYSNGPTTANGALKDVTNHYMFNIGGQTTGSSGEIIKYNEITKVGIDENGKEINVTTPTGQTEKVKVSPLAGVTLGLYTDENCTTLYTNDKYTQGATFTTTDDGIISFYGLESGNYWIKEISAPAGYIMDNSAHPVVISATYTSTQVTETENGISVTYDIQYLSSYTITIDGKNVNEYTASWDNQSQTVVNEQYTVVPSYIINDVGAQLPSTGGIGTTILYIIGGIMVLLAVVFLITKRRVAKANKDIVDDIL
jgi:fimbrial isopeptide formation D2 family protein/LPXTG-motif cell wall-anchored protein